MRKRLTTGASRLRSSGARLRQGCRAIMSTCNCAATIAVASRGSIQTLLDGFVRQVRQFLQLVDQAGPAPFTHSADRDAGVMDVMQFVVAALHLVRHAGGRQGSCGSPSNHRDPFEGRAANHPDRGIHRFRLPLHWPGCTGQTTRYHETASMPGPAQQGFGG